MDSQLKMLQLIRDCKMPVGATYISNKTGISQATVGRMLLALEQQGFLEKISNKGRLLTRQGLDYIDRQDKLNDKMETARSIIETAESNSKHKLYEILEIRLALEALSAEQACYNATPKALQQLDAIILEHFYDLKNGGIGSEQDLQLHLKIAELSGNRTLTKMLRLILTQENAYTKFSMVSPHITSTQIKQHTDIVEAIREKNGPKAKMAMIVHLKQVMEDVQTYYR